MNGRTCGSCTFCCKVMEVTELAKPAGEWCRHCRPGWGCGVYANRPAECQAFVCRWLADPNLPDNLRPDKIKVMLCGDEVHDGLVAHCDPANPLAWRNEPMFSLLKRAARQIWASDRTVTVRAAARTWLITPAAEYDLGIVAAGAPIEVTKHADGTADVRVLTPPPRVQLPGLVARQRPLAAPRP
jgi:hypothetical protein